MKNRGQVSVPLVAMLLTALAGMLVTGLLAGWLERANQARLHKALNAATERVADGVVKRLELYQYGLRGARGTLLTTGEWGMSRDIFGRYARSRDVSREFPGARGFGLIRRVPKNELETFLARARADGPADFRLHELSPHDGEHYIIQYIEPLAGNEPAIGLDIASERNRREAALSAMRSGEVRLTAPITLVQYLGKPHQSFLILMPIYREGVVPITEAERERQLMGWSYAPLITEQVLQGLDLVDESVRLRLRDISEGEDEPLFYEGSGATPEVPELLNERVLRTFYGRRWEIELAALPLFAERLNMASPALVWGGGIGLSLLLAALLGASLVSRRRKHQVQAEQARLAAIVENSADGIVGQTLGGAITSWNQGAEAILGYSAEQAIGQDLAALVVPERGHEQEETLLRQALAGERISLYETRYRRQDGSLVHVALSIAPILDGLGRVVGISRTVRDITAQKQAEARVLELNASLETQVAERTAQLLRTNVLLDGVLTAATEVSIIATDPDGLIRVFNRGAERLLGYSAEELVGRQTPALLHVTEEVVARGRELSTYYGKPVQGFRVFVQVPELEGSEAREWTYVRKDGSRFPVTLVVTAMRDEQGRITGYLGIALDITERKATERRLAESLATTRAVLDTAVNPVITFDAEERIQTFNPAGGVVFGVSPEHMVGRSIEDLIEPVSLERFHELLTGYEQPVEGLGPSGMELWGRRSDDSAFPMQVTLAPMLVGGEQRMVCVVTDLSEQYQQRKELVATRDQLLLASEVAGLGIWSWFLDDNRLNWNDRMFELYGQPRSLREQGLTFDHWRQRVHPDDMDRVVAQLQGAIAGTAVYDPIFRIVRPDGQVRYIQAAAQIERDSLGRPTRVTGINLDITAQRELESRLRDARDKADAASAAKSFFLANMSHEIRTPMNAVLGMLHLVQDTGLDSRQLDYVLKAQSAARSLLGLLNDILDYSKIEAGKLQLDPHPFELESLMRDLAVVLAGNQGDKDVEVMFDLDANLPLHLVGDSFRLQQVLINLGGNALKFTSRGQVVVAFRQLACDDTSALLQVSISDTGIGISPEQLERIFDGFTQAEASTSRRFGGTGLGLVICKRLVELMGAELKVESRPGEGSRFWFDVRLGISEPVAALRSECPCVDAPLHLLVVDDNPVAGEVLLRTLLSLGWRSEYVMSGEAAVSAVQQAARRGDPFDLVLMDWRMPGLDGLASSRALAALGAAAPRVVMITAHGSEVLADQQQKGRAPFAAFLTKPVTPQQLATAVERAIWGEEVDAGQPASVARVRHLAGLCLLVVEDNALNRQVASELLMGEGAEVVLAEGGLEGVQAVLEEPERFDAVLMDIQMPDIDGLEASRRIRLDERCRTLPIIAMTANASEQDRRTCLEAGMNDHVGKPVDIQQLTRVLLFWTGGATPALPEPPPPRPDPGAQVLLETPASILSRFADNLPLLQTVLVSFREETERQLEQLQQARDDGDLRGVLAALHGIKGSTGTMGARALSHLAMELENRGCGLTPDTAAPFLEDPSWLLQMRALLVESNQQLLEQFQVDASTGQGQEPLPALDEDAWREALQQTLELLASGSIQALDRARELKGRAPDSLREAAAAFAARVERLDFQGAQALARDLLPSDAASSPD
ncbi:PAS domain S-box protein [Pseudomonas otitidis]|uniref:PAS domain S-box protein n=1 Tax=Metapseudomonas otitidis TaxID=319939 RepID=UPI00244BC4F3|nr:PAS domain S-box protein [Pseudomonas otitidis]MDH1105799.1 PAS domain S-box protein [Pseudomonas otitidis]MDH1156946.1 PAS domain S-box protein [Pseudomonas otitidis]MDH1162250.1 PAS domain S-box protein [Pseudomonas otitidis]